MLVRFLNQNAPAVQAFAGVAALVLAGVLVRVTWRYAQSTEQLAKSTEDMAVATRAMVAEQVQHRNLLERQIHGRTVDVIRTTSIALTEASGRAASLVRGAPGVDVAEYRFVAERISFVTQHVLDQYWSQPGRPIDASVADMLPGVGMDYGAWVRSLPEDERA